MAEILSARDRRIRQQRAQQDAARRVQEVAEEWRQAEAQRDCAARTRGSRHLGLRGPGMRTSYSKNISNWFLSRHRTISEPTKAYLNQREAFNRRYGAAAVQAYKAGHELALRAGLQPDTADYFKFVDDALEMHGRAYNGVRFDPTEKALTANEVCKMTGLSADQYNAQWRRMHAEGRDSNSQARAQWGKKVG